MKRRVRFAGWLFKRSRFARAVFVFSVWPFVYLTDRWRGDEPASLRRGLQWVRDGEFAHEPAIKTSGTPATVRRPAPSTPTADPPNSESDLPNRGRRPAVPSTPEETPNG